MEWMINQAKPIALDREPLFWQLELVADHE
jgi:hypothetical protein